jgi:DNA-binding transcriptional ArsR family regulator
MSNLDIARSESDPAKIFAALGDPVRLGLVERLGDGHARSISHLTEGSGLTRQGVTKHLRVLEKAGLVKSKKAGRESRFLYVPDAVNDARSYLDDICRQWDEALASLKAFVEK